ncbi:MAG TPA: trypsin-like peptidase domain-containing protein [Streptosporangiaceae bacterium]|nr:trypsin-like peptidase domain-containing protein [Streptosporangiaceae bacterium]
MEYLVQFPVAGGGSLLAGRESQEAEVVRWFPPPRAGAAGDDLACLELAAEPPSDANPGRLAINVPAFGHSVRVFGFPGTPARPDGAWVPTIVQGRVASGRLQLDSGPDAALRVQPGYSGSPVFDEETGRIVGLLSTAPPVHAAERDSYAIAADGSLRIWDIAVGTARTMPRGPGGAVRSVVFSPDGTLVIVVFDHGSARIWDIASRASRATLRDLDGDVRSVAFSADGVLLATASNDGSIRTWDIAARTARTARAALQGHFRGLNGLAFSSDGTLLATASDDKTARIWDVVTGTARSVLRSHAARIWSTTFSPDGTLLAAVSVDKTARVWDVVTGDVRATLQGHAFGLNGVAFSPDGTLLATASDDKTARVWDFATGTVRATLQGHIETIRSIAFSPSSPVLATVSDDGSARIWDVAGTSRAVLIPLDDGGYATITNNGYKLEGKVGDRFWWAVKLCRFDPGELDDFVPGLNRLPADAPIFPEMLRDRPGS